MKSRTVLLFVLELTLYHCMLLSEARALEVTRMASGGLQLSGRFCDEVSNQIFQLVKWTNSVNSSHCISVKPAQSPSVCTAEITDCVPKYVSEHHGLRAAHAGPNCYNLVMVSKGVMPYDVKTTAQEMSFYKNSTACRKLGASDPKRAGDVGSITNGPDTTGLDDVHGFIYATDQLAYTKNGDSLDNPYQLTSLKSTLDTYHVGQRKSENKDDPECYQSRQPQCRGRIRVDYYRCKPMDEVIRDAPATTLKEKSVQAVHLFDQVDLLLSKAFFEAQAPDSRLLPELDAAATHAKNFLETELLKEVHSTQPNPQELFILGMLKLRIDNLRSFIGTGSLAELDGSWLKKLSTASSVLPEVESF